MKWSTPAAVSNISENQPLTEAAKEIKGALIKHYSQRGVGFEFKFSNPWMRSTGLRQSWRKHCSVDADDSNSARMEILHVSSGVYFLFNIKFNSITDAFEKKNNDF